MKVAPEAVEWKTNVAVVDVVRGVGPLSISVSGTGGVVTTTLLLTAETLPAPS